MALIWENGYCEETFGDEGFEQGVLRVEACTNGRCSPFLCHWASSDVERCAKVIITKLRELLSLLRMYNFGES